MGEGTRWWWPASLALVTCQQTFQAELGPAACSFLSRFALSGMEDKASFSVLGDQDLGGDGVL